MEILVNEDKTMSARGKTEHEVGDLHLKKFYSRVLKVRQTKNYEFSQIVDFLEM